MNARTNRAANRQKERHLHLMDMPVETRCAAHRRRTYEARVADETKRLLSPITNDDDARPEKNAVAIANSQPRVFLTFLLIE